MLEKMSSSLSAGELKSEKQPLTEITRCDIVFKTQ